MRTKTHNILALYAAFMAFVFIIILTNNKDLMLLEQRIWQLKKDYNTTESIMDKHICNHDCSLHADDAPVKIHFFGRLRRGKDGVE